VLDSNSYGASALATSLDSNLATVYTIESLPFTSLASLTPSLESADPKLGAGLFGFSFNDRYLFSRDDSLPHSLWIWDLQRLNLVALLNHMSAVRCCAWHPSKCMLAIGTASAKLFLWTPQGSSIVQLPNRDGDEVEIKKGVPPKKQSTASNNQLFFQIRKIQWSSDGKCLLLMDKNRYCCCFLRE
jgi:WD40 repeat protein